MTLGLSDGQVPYTYYFVIKATAEGGNIRWIESLSLNTYCPTSVPLVGKASATISKNSWIGATGTDSYYVFQEFVPTLPKCSYVTGYTVYQFEPTNILITYPSNLCMSSPCLWVDFDVSASQTIKFKVTAISTLDSSSTHVTDLITIIVNPDANTPTITPTNLAVIPASFLLNSVAVY